AVYYPGLASHPQHALAGELFAGRRAVLSFGLDPPLDCFDFLNRLRCVVLSSNLGDNRTLAIPVAHTIFHEMGPERRAGVGSADSMIRLSVGIGDCDGLIAAFSSRSVSKTATRASPTPRCPSLSRPKANLLFHPRARRSASR